MVRYLNQSVLLFLPRLILRCSTTASLSSSDHLGRIEYETELVVRICKLGKTIPQRFAHRYYDAVTVGIDFTAREMQKKLREAGQLGS